MWTGALNSGGYPVTWKDNKTVYMHRYIMKAQKGEIVLHTCDNPSCINPNHLKIGTYKENSQDMVAKNRQAIGERCGNSKFTQEVVDSIRKLQGTSSSRKVGLQYGMSKTNVLDIWNNNIWRV